MDPVRLAIIGAGGIGARHIELAVQEADCELTAIVDPASALAVLSTAPMPVVTAQPNKQTLSSGASDRIFARAISGTTARSANVEVPMKWWSVLPRWERRHQ